MSQLEDYCVLTQSNKVLGQSSSTSIKQIVSERTIQTLLCFKCGGKKPMIRKCQQCSSTGFIKETHSLCDLLNQVIQNKFKKGKSRLQKKVSITPISEQSMEEKFQFCNKCQRQCQSNYLHCYQCPQIIICKGCIENYHHFHQLTDNTNEKPLSNKKCSSCGIILQCRYEYCTICQKNGGSYILCCQCKSQKMFNHQHSSFCLSLMLDSKTIEKSRISNSSRDKQKQDLIIQVNSVLEVSDKVLQVWNSPVNVSMLTTDEDHFMTSYQQNRLRPSISKLVQSNYVEQIDKSLLGSKKNGIDQSQICMNFSFLQSSSRKMFQSNRENEIQQNPFIIRKIETESQEDNNDYVFSGYNCDICNILPIKKIRYHCLECDDFDMCRKCYKNRRLEHQHQQFQMINGQEKRRRKIQKFKYLAQQSAARKQFR